MEVITAPSPDCYFREENETWADYSTRQFAHLEIILKQHTEDVCAGSMRMYDPIYLTLIREACDKYCEQGAISPDFLSLSKGLTCGYLPLSAVLTTDKIYDAFYDNYTSQKAFLHTHRYTGNALVCRTALATLTIFLNTKRFRKQHMFGGKNGRVIKTIYVYQYA